MLKAIAVVFVLAVLAFGLSIEEKLTDVSERPENMKEIGLRYEVIGPVDAYGIRRSSQSQVEYVTLIPPPGIAGSEVGFRIPVVGGSKVVVTKVFKTNRWPDPNMTLEVRLEGTKLPVDVPTRIDLFRGNEGSSGLQLNPNIYRRLPLG
jgi:hypothetical protein